MTPRGRTNQLLYHAELLLGAEVKDDEHAAARRMAHEEGALPRWRWRSTRRCAS